MDVLFYELSICTIPSGKDKFVSVLNYARLGRLDINSGILTSTLDGGV
jgi:hypothetical protein